jgi:hypothetical protein
MSVGAVVLGHPSATKALQALTDQVAGPAMPLTTPILVTGSHHSGTTWVGKVVSSEPGIGYIDEPFNPLRFPHLHGPSVGYWFPYLTEANADAETRSDVNKRIRFELSAAARVRQVRSFRDVGRLVRHPAAFTASILVRHETHDFNDFLRQPDLMEDYLAPFADDVESFAATPRDLVDQGALLWCVLNSVLVKMVTAHPDWMVVRHEDLCDDPTGGFMRLFKYLEVPFTPRVRATILAWSDSGNSVDGRRPDDVRRNTRDVRRSWHRRLTTDEILRIRRRVGEHAERFYGPGDWG